MHYLKTGIAALALLSAASSAVADTLNDAMVQAAQTNPSLAAQRARLSATREQLPQAWAEALPSLSIGAVATQSDTSGFGGGPQNEHWSAGANASQLLFGSGRVLASTRSARAEIRGAVADYDLIFQNLLLSVVAAYADVRQVQAVVTARQTSVENLTTLNEYAQAQFDAGVVTRTDVAQAQARLAQARTQLVQAQGAMAAAVQAYLRLVGAPPSNLEIPPEAEGLPTDLETALNDAGDQSPVLRGAVASAEQADANVWIARTGGLPRVTLEAGTSRANDFDVSDDFESRSDSVSLRFSWPIINGGAVASRTRQSRALRSAANLDVAAAQRSVQESVTNAWTGLASARAAQQSAREQEEAAALAYQGVRLEQETGLRSTIDVLNQEEDLLTARLARAQAERDLVVAERQLLASVGVLSIPANATTEQQRSEAAPPAEPATTPPPSDAPKSLPAAHRARVLDAPTPPRTPAPLRIRGRR